MKRLIAAAALILIATAGFGFDVGGSIDNLTGGSLPLQAEEPAGLIQRTTAALWARTPLGGWVFDAQGSYTYTPVLPVLFEIDRMTLATSVGALEAGVRSLSVTLGRTVFADPSGNVLVATLDGVHVEAGQQRSALRFGVATNALRFRPTNPIAISRLDVSPTADADRRLASPRLIASADYTLLDAFARQTITLGVLVQEDLRPRDELTAVGGTTAVLDAGGRLDTQYVTAGVSGSLAPGLYHRTSYTLNSGRTLGLLEDDLSGTGYSYQYALILAHMASSELVWFLPGAGTSRLRLFGLFSTGDPDAPTSVEGNTEGTATSFVPLAPPRYSDGFSLKPGNSSHVGVSYGLRPFSGRGSDVLQTELRGVAYLRTAGTGAVSEGAVDARSIGHYVGTDVNLEIAYQPFSDVRLVLTNGVFVPNAAVMVDGSKHVTYQGTLQGVLRF
jgi:hypothetical protein